MLPLYFVVPTCKKTLENASDAQLLLHTPSKYEYARNYRLLSFTAAIQNWRSMTITKLTQSAAKIPRLKNTQTQNLPLSVAAADSKIELFFNCRPL
jgi:hypothetical protein